MLDGLALLTPTVLLYVTLAVVLCTVVMMTPGLGGSFALAISLPFVFRMDPVSGLAFIMGIVAINGTGNTVTTILFGIPGSSSSVASLFDGYPMTQRGEGVRAVSAGLFSSLFGGLIGAFAFAATLPILRPIVMAVRPPEFIIIILLAVISISFIGQGNALKSLISGGLGFMLAFIGLAPSSGAPRYAFGQLYLWDGLALVPLILGLYAIAEMISLFQKGGSIARIPPQTDSRRQIAEGFRDTIRHFRIVIQSSLIGLWVGLAPGLGDSAAQYIAYSQAVRSSKDPEKFGKGAIEGVIAADAATNSKEGGALVPTVAFGIPGSSTYAIVLAALLAFGIQPGPQMLTENMDIVWMLFWVLVLSNILAVGASLAFLPGIQRLTSVNSSIIGPPILVLAVLGAYSANSNIRDIIAVVAFGFIGYGMKVFGYSRPILLIGFVLGRLLERNMNLVMNVWGYAFLQRPIVLILIALTLVMFLQPWIKNMRARRRTEPTSSAMTPS